jgi:molybdenum cofactor guanylyltransferase
LTEKTGITGIVLSGGKSSRMGEEKGLAVFNGRPLIKYAIEILENVCDEVLISANNHQEEYAKFNCRVIADVHEGVGPMGGLSACLEQSASRLNAVLSCDTPFIPADLFTYLAVKLDNQQAAIPVYQGYPEPLCGIYATNTLWYMNDLISKRQYKMMDLLDAIYCVKVEINHTLPFFTEDMFLNINTGKDLKTAETGRNKR